MTPRADPAAAAAPTVAVRTSEPPRSGLRMLARNGAHLAALSAFAFAQPLFDLLDDSADFFAVRGSSRWEIVLFAVAVILLPPAALLLVEALAGLVSRRLREVLHLVFVGGLAAVVAVQVLKRATDLTSTEGLLTLAVLVGAVVALLYRRIAPLRSFLTALAPAPLVFLVLFLLVSPVSQLTLARGADVRLASVGAHAPVVMVVFDEFPVTDLVTADGEIDAERFPSFARLASESTWFRNTTTVSAGTTRAVPAIMTGRYARAGDPPVFAEHPRNIFTLLGGDYRMNVREIATDLCPEELCQDRNREDASSASLASDVSIAYLHLVAPPRLEESLPSITSGWLNFGRDTNVTAELIADAAAAAAASPAAPAPQTSGLTRRERAERRQRREQLVPDPRGRDFAEFVASLRPTARPALNFVHLGLPHLPWRRFPSGRQSTVDLVVRPGWHFLYRRHMLQVGYVDRLLGDLLARLDETGLYESSLVVVTADHGISFRPRGSHRATTPDNLQDLAFVPLFVKAPGQREGAVVDYHVQTIDILPTIADVLGIRIPWQIDGRSALTDPHRDTVRMAHIYRLSDYRPPETTPYAPLLVRKQAAVARKVELVGAGDWSSLFVSAAYRPLLGRRVATLPVAGSSGDHAAISDEATRTLLERYDPALPFVPSPLTGRIAGDGAREGRTLAVAVNGRIAAVAVTYAVYDNIHFAALAPESAFRLGRNEVDVYWLEGDDAASARLAKLEMP
ncbi:MAG: sulfatase-like hydrolase/transferase [Gaiellaceae bacterium]